ncbi:unnamed protein product [Merluccius merluccius]
METTAAPRRPPATAQTRRPRDGGREDDDVRGGGGGGAARPAGDDGEAATTTVTPPPFTRSSQSHWKRGGRQAGSSHPLWSASMCRSAWKMAHRSGYRFSQLTSDPQRRAMLRQHALDCKSTIPLSMECMVEKEALAILQRTLKDYKSKLGSTHPLTSEVRDRVSTLTARLAARGVDPQTGEHPGVVETLQGLGRNLVSRLRCRKTSTDRDTAGLADTATTSDHL